MLHISAQTFGLVARVVVVVAIALFFLLGHGHRAVPQQSPLSNKPELKQFADLQAADFDRHPIWIAVHGHDSDAPWYNDDGIDEETFRPWTGSVPVAFSEGMLLVRGGLTLANGSKLPGFATPAPEKNDLGTIQPYVFVKNKMFAFWGGRGGTTPQERAAFYAAVGKQAAEVFPVSFAFAPSLVSSQNTVTIEGFYRLVENAPVAER